MTSASLNQVSDSAAQFVFSQAPAFPVVLQPGDQLQVAAAYQPTGPGASAESIDLTTSEFSPAAAYRIPLVGEATPTASRTDSFTATGPLEAFVLLETPDQTRLTVSVNGVLVPAAGNWTYDAPSNSVTFTAGSASAPQEGDAVAIVYLEVCSA